MLENNLIETETVFYMAQYLLTISDTKQDFDMSVRKKITFYSLLVTGSLALVACSPNGQFMNPLTVKDGTLHRIWIVNSH